MDTHLLLLIIDGLLLVILIGLLFYETRKVVELEAKETLFIESNSELFVVVNGNANVLREILERQDTDSKTLEFFKIILDAHAHVLRVYAPALEFSKPSLFDQVENAEKISNQDFRNL